MTFASPEDVEVRLGRPFTDSERLQVQAWLDDAETVIRTRIPNLDVLALDPTYRALVVVVECAAVIRVARNPDGKLVERIDDYSWTRDKSTATGQLALLDDEWQLLTPATSTGAFTIRPYGATLTAEPDPWVTL